MPSKNSTNQGNESNEGFSAEAFDSHSDDANPNNQTSNTDSETKNTSTEVISSENTSPDETPDTPTIVTSALEFVDEQPSEDNQAEHFIEYEDVEYDVDEVPPDTIIDSKFKIISLLGVGSLSVVYLAEHLYLQKQVALKIFKPVDMDENIRFARIQQEAITLASISHPNIVGVTDLGITGTTPYIVQEFIEGMDLQDLLKRDGCFPENRCSRLFSQLCDGIAYLHASGIVHRDIKPANVIVSQAEDGTESAKLIDLGIAKQDNPGGALHTFTTSGSIFGSPFYMSPEQCQGAKIDKRSDIYSLGCLMYEVLTGSPPFRGATMLLTLEKHINETAKPVNERRKDAPVSHRLEMIVMKCLAKNPDNRFQSSDEVSKALKKLGHDRLQGRALKVLIAMGLMVCLIPIAWHFLWPGGSSSKAKGAATPFADKHVSAVMNKSESAHLFEGWTSLEDSISAYEEALKEGEKQKAPAHVQLDIAQRLARLYLMDRKHTNRQHKIEALWARVKNSIEKIELSNQPGSLLKNESAGSAAVVCYYMASSALDDRNYDVAASRFYRALNLAQRAPKEMRLVSKINRRLAELKLQTGKLAEGTGLLESILKDDLEIFGQDDENVISLRLMLIQAYKQQGKLDQVARHSKFIRGHITRLHGAKAGKAGEQVKILLYGPTDRQPIQLPP